ncbi:EF-hand calcium-binding domain-containing protein 13 [Vombatus ursinus]|uniref:EF-hand calcium-binding domain-containing protein 13 n=1 Tax=Vombatus ursinus TaxID=29139 RepID=UPI000FFCF9C6|nr:EF-hand calcium-binding domain-containing protein 13 [Vombatus ursinus]
MRNNLLQRPPFLEEIFVNTSQATRDSATVNFKDRRRGREALNKACKIFSNIRNGKIYVNDVLLTLHALKISMSDGELHQALKCVYVDVNGMLDFSKFMEILNDRGSFSQDPAFQEAYQIFSKIKGGRVEVEDILPLLKILGVSVIFSIFQEVMNYLSHDDNETVDFRDFLFSLGDLQQQYEDVVSKDWSSQDESDRRFSKPHASRLFQQLRKKSNIFPRSSESASTRFNRKTFGERGFEESLDLLSPQQNLKNNLNLKKTFERVDSSVLESLRTNSKTSISLKKLVGQSEMYKMEAQPPKAIPGIRRSFHEADISVESQQKILKTEKSHELEPVKSNSRKSLEEINKYEIRVTGTQPHGSSISLKKYMDVEEIPSVKKSSSFPKYWEEPEQKYGISVPDFQPLSVKSSQILRKLSSKVHIPESPAASLDLVELQPEKAKEKFRKKQPLKVTEDIQDSLGFYNKLTEDKVAVDELQPVLKIIGMDLSDDELDKVLQMTPANDTEMVDLKDFMVNLAKARQFSEYNVLKDAIDVVKEFEDEKVPLDKVQPKLKKLGVYCSLNEFNKALEEIPPDSKGEVEFNKFVKTLMSNPSLGKRKSIEESLEKVEKFKGNKASVHDLWDTLHTLDPDLTEKEFQEALKAVPKDEDKNVDFDEFFQALEDTRQQAQETITPFEKIFALNKIKDDKVAKKDLDYVLKSMGIILPEEQLEKSLVSTDDGSVNIKDFVSTLRSSDSFSNFVALRETINAMDQNKTIPLLVKDVYADILQHRYASESMGIQSSDQEIQDALGAPVLEGPERDKFNVFMTALSQTEKLPVKDALKKGVDVFTHLEDGKIGVEDLKHALADLNINLPKENLDQVIASCATDENENLQLKDVTSALAETPEFADSIEQGQVDLSKFMGILSKVMLIPEAAGVKESLSQINIPRSDENIIAELQERLNVRGIHLSDENIQEALDATVSEDGMVNLKDFVNNLAMMKKFRDCQSLEASLAVTNVTDGKVKVSDLPPILESLGASMGEEEIKETSKSLEVDETQNICDVVNNVTDGKINIEDLEPTLESLGIEVKEKEVKETLKSIQPDGIQNAQNIVTNIVDEKVNIADVMPTLESMGVELSKEKLTETIKPIKPDEKRNVKFQDIVNNLISSKDALKGQHDGKIDFKDAIKQFIKQRKSQTAQQIQKAQNIVSTISSGMVHVDDLSPTLENFGIELTDDMLKETLESVGTDETEKAFNAVTNFAEGKVKISDMPSTLESLGVKLTKQDIQETLKTVETDGIEDACNVVTNVIDGGKVKFDELMPTLQQLGVKVSDDDIQETLKTVTPDATTRLPSGYHGSLFLILQKESGRMNCFSM